MAKILIVEDDEPLSLAIERWLEQHGHTVDVVFDGAEALDRLKFYQYDLAVLDWQLPTMSGLEVCLEYRREQGCIPILVLTSRSAVTDKTTGLDAGADDYVTKPFEQSEFLSRVRALLRRPRAIEQDQLTIGDIKINITARTVTRGGALVSIAPREFALLEFFMRHPEQVFSVQSLLDKVWSSESECTPESVRPYITQLRSKLGSNLIQTVHGFGYKLNKQ